MGKLGAFLLLFAGGLGALATGGVLGSTLGTILHAPREPRPATVADAAPGAWVVLSDAALRCDSRVTRPNATFFLATDRAGAHPFVVELVGADIACDAAQGRLEGAFVATTVNAQFVREKIGLAAPEGTPFRIFTQVLTPAFQRRVLWRTLPWFALSIALVVLGLNRLRRAVVKAAG
jgi:hypothetical protein